MCIRTPNTGQLNPLFHTFAEFLNRVVARQSTDLLVANAQFSPNAPDLNFTSVVAKLSTTLTSMSLEKNVSVVKRLV